ncbi:MAG TPA: LptF/LptG family permease [Spirochaetota bacterium]|nr:LptF/LptG family permease [Spirochaetota bacterium]HOL58042.1 LptF/LptG family permease [Spirochaetota bacterium]HPP04379.1 LptF/LptG family permease [Spirochaetota bacterium]
MRYYFRDILYIILEYLSNIPKRFFNSLLNFINFIKNFNIKEAYHSIYNFIKRPLLPWTLYRMLFTSFLYWFIIIQGLLIIIVIIFDLFVKLDKYMQFSVSIPNIIFISFLLIPKAIWLTIPVAIMFGITMTLGMFYQNNELIAIFTSRISLYKFTMPIIIFNIILSFVMIFVDSYIIIPTNRYRDKLFEKLTEKSKSSDNDNITIRGNNDYFWNAERFIASKNTLEKVIVFKLDKDFKIVYRLEAENAAYTKNGWLFNLGILREWDNSGDLVSETRFQKRYFPFSEKPSVFKKAQYDIENMTISEAKETIELYKSLNVEHNKELTNYYKKFSFPFTLLIVALFALGVATVSKTNVTILALFFSIGLAILYYVMQLILDVLAYNGRIPAIIGAWLPFFFFLPISLILVKNAKS